MTDGHQWLRIAEGLLVYALLSVLSLWVIHWARPRSGTSAVAGFILERVIAPIAGVIVILVFVATSYPSLYGDVALPPLNHVIFSSGGGRTNTLINVLFLLSVLLPLISWNGRSQALILPLQAMAATGLVFHWATEVQDLRVRFVPPLGLMTLIGLLAYLGYLAASTLSHRIARSGAHLLNERDLEIVAYTAAILWFQVPSIIVYGNWLGSQAFSR